MLILKAVGVIVVWLLFLALAGAVVQYLLEDRSD